MSILRMIGKEIKVHLRNISSLLIYTLMPLVLILILGVTFGTQMDGEGLEMDEMTIKYQVVGDAADLTEGFLTIMGEGALGDNNEIIETEDQATALSELADGRITCFVRVDEMDKVFTIYKNNLYNTEASMVEAVMATYVARYNAIMEIVKVNPQALAGLDLEKPADSYTSLVALGQENHVKSMDYYGIAMVVLFVMYGILQSFSNVIEERKTGTGNRMLGTSINKAAFFAGKMSGQILTLAIQLGAVVLFSALVFGVSWGEKPLLPLLLVFTQMVMAVSIGIAMGLVLGTEGAGMTMGHMIIVLSAFFGGSYVPVSQLGGMALIGRFFSPIWWVQSGIINYIYLGEADTLIQAMLVCLGVAAVMFTVSVFKIRGTEGLAHA